MNDPKQVEVMFQDKLPPETDELEVDDQIANKEQSNNDYKNYVKNLDSRKTIMNDKFPIEKTGDYIKIS